MHAKKEEALTPNIVNQTNMITLYMYRIKYIAYSRFLHRPWKLTNHINFTISSPAC